MQPPLTMLTMLSPTAVAPGAALSASVATSTRAAAAAAKSLESATSTTASKFCAALETAAQAVADAIVDLCARCKLALLRLVGANARDADVARAAAASATLITSARKEQPSTPDAPLDAHTTPSGAAISITSTPTTTGDEDHKDDSAARPDGNHASRKTEDASGKSEDASAATTTPESATTPAPELRIPREIADHEPARGDPILAAYAMALAARHAALGPVPSDTVLNLISRLFEQNHNLPFMLSYATAIVDVVLRALAFFGHDVAAAYASLSGSWMAHYNAVRLLHRPTPHHAMDPDALKEMRRVLSYDVYVRAA